MYCLYTETMREKTINEIKLVSTQQAPYMLKYCIISYIYAYTDCFPSKSSPDPLWT